MNKRLSPEFNRALAVLDARLDTISYTKNLPEVMLWQHNTFVKVFGAISSKQIPSGQGWSWSQTKGRRIVYMSERKMSVMLFKLLPRITKKSPYLHAPSFKVWKFEIRHDDATYPTTVLWCERGEQPDICSLPLLQDLNFLSEFMDPENASCFWPELYA